MRIPIDAALRDPTLIGAALGDPASWANWIAVLKAAYGLKLTAKEHKTFTDVAQRQPPKGAVK